MIVCRKKINNLINLARGLATEYSALAGQLYIYPAPKKAMTSCCRVGMIATSQREKHCVSRSQLLLPPHGSSDGLNE
jgi:hypothetical protein